MTRLGKKELNALLRGCAFLGSGGGGSIKAGEMFIDRILKEGGVELTDKAPEGGGCVFADIGANAAIEAGQIDALVHSFDKMEQYQKASHGSELTCLFPVETGPENTFAPLVLGAIKKLPVYDGDGGGRAVPEIQLCSFASAGISAAPVVLTNEGNDAIIAFADSASEIDEMLRPITAASQFGNSASMALFAAKNSDLVKASVKGAISYAMNVGQFLDVLKEKDALPESLQTEVNKRNACLLSYGEVTAVEDEMEGAFDLGKVVIHDVMGKGSVSIYTQNENIIAFSSKESATISVAPHSICYLKSDLQPVTNAELKKGDRIWLMGVEAQSELTTPAVMSGFAKVLSGLGYAGSVGSLHPNLSWAPLGDVLKSLPEMEDTLNTLL